MYSIAKRNYDLCLIYHLCPMSLVLTTKFYIFAIEDIHKGYDGNVNGMRDCS